MEWPRFLELASKLADSDKEEYQRTAISRAYYAAFCETREWLERHQGVSFDARHRSVHSQVWSALTNPDPNLKLGRGSQRIRKQASSAGTRLKTKRLRADYEKQFKSIIKNDVQQSLKDAKTVIKCLNDLTERISQ